MSTVEVENVVRQGALLDLVVVGKITAADKHPNADKLKVCRVNLGNETAVIVCGGINVSPGMLVAVAKAGAKVHWHGENDLVELKPTAIRGVESHGMICGADEIGLSEMFPKKDEKEILDLTAIVSERTVGKPLADVLGLNDAILEIDNKSLSNRPDLWGHYGLAREVAALFNRAVKPYETKAIAAAKDQTIKLSVRVEDKKLCPKYMAVAMSGVKAGPSPEWLRARLRSIGLRPINSIVDITNYVMHDLGQPLHAFDEGQISDSGFQTSEIRPPTSDLRHRIKIVVRPAHDGEKFTALDGKERALTREMLVIANDSKPLALAGVMGGEDCGITPDTTEIIFEAANFDAASIRRTSTALGLRTDSSARFEKSLDPNLCETALRRAVELVRQVCPSARVASAVISEGKPRLFTGPLEMPIAIFEKKLGLAIPVKTVISILERLGFGIEAKKTYLKVKIPTWRATRDIASAEDVVEEVARIHGYDAIPSCLPVFSITPPPTNPLRNLERGIATALADRLGFSEVYNYSFVSALQAAALGDDASRYIELDNPLSKEKPFVRRSLLPNLLENIRANSARYDELRLFEIGKVFLADEPGPRAEANGNELLPRQDTWLTAVYAQKKNAAPFWEARRVYELLTEQLHLKLDLATAAGASPWQKPGRLAEIKSGETVVGGLYELHPAAMERIGLESQVAVLELNMSALMEHGGAMADVRYVPLPHYPEVARDLALVVPVETTHERVVRAVRNIDPLLVRVELFDLYQGAKDAKQKSLAYHFTYRHPERTLTTDEVDRVEKKIIAALAAKCGATLRT